MRFVDTNILLYAASAAPEERSKARAASLTLEGDDLALSVQVPQEFYVQATRGAKQDRLTHEQAILLIESFRLRFPVQETTPRLLKAALAAREIGCDTILSEDLNHGQDFDGVKVINPFRKISHR